MPVQMIAIEEVQIMDFSDDVLELVAGGGGGFGAPSVGTASCWTSSPETCGF